MMAVGDAYVFPGFLTLVLTRFFLSKPPTSAEVRGKNTPERKFALTGGRSHNHQVMSPTRSPLSQPGGRTDHNTMYRMEIFGNNDNNND